MSPWARLLYSLPEEPLCTSQGGAWEPLSEDLAPGRQLVSELRLMLNKNQPPEDKKETSGAGTGWLES